MTVKSLPAAPEGRPFARENRDLPSSAMERWNGGIKAAKSDDNSISVFDVIGADWYGDGVTASRIAAALRAIGGADVTVNINSPGGDMFEGLAIYNLLREYDGKVTVKVLGLAASAASIIAMAGDEVQIGRGAFLMIHNCWVYAMGNRHDLAVEPPAPTVLKKLVDEKGGEVVSIGKIADIYANVGITKKVKATGIDALFDATLIEMEKAGDNTIVFTNFVDFDSSYGHRRDVAGYAAALELFDRRLPELLKLVKDEDIIIFPADHGCDPTWPGTDHTREHIPVLVYGPKVKPGSLGHRETFADIGQTVANYFGLSPMDYGKTLF